MLRARWFRLTALMALLLAAAFIHFTLRSARPGITGANFDRLEIGMSQAEVETLLDGPPRLDPHFLYQWEGCVPGGNRTRAIWTSSSAAVILFFDERGRLDEKIWYDAPDSLRAWRRWLPGI